MEGDRTMKLPLLAALVLSLAAGCSSAPASDAPQPTGYKLTAETVVFQFKAWKYSYATNGETGQWIPLGKIPRIDLVAVAGPFNGWSTTASALAADDQGGYQLTMDLADLRGLGPKIPFKFVINGLWWVEPTVLASNSVETNFVNKSSNLVLTLPQERAP